ncbi:MAG: hypothetical protein E7175_01425 [Erysipelotrichaceae bacterium]|nr:hypothetical protein [Erysipelotrichaceae bacterium]
MIVEVLSMIPNLYLPIGVDDFKTVKKDCYYVDKTLFLEDIINSPESATFLFTRPRRFGKSLMLSLCKYFFDINEDSLTLFKDTNIINKDHRYAEYINKYNVIHLNLKGINGRSYADYIELLKFKISDIYSDLINPENDFENNVINRKCTNNELKESLYYLTKKLYKKNNVKTIILIDEYDTPLETAYVNGYFDDARDLMKDFLGNAIKSNPYLYKAIVTGITQVSHSSIFSDLNNLMVNNILSNKDEFFGFTDDEVEKLLRYSNFNGDYNEVKRWYGGYFFQNKEVYNPWSILNFISNIFVYKAYWTNTGSYKLLHETVKLLSGDVNSDLVSLTNGENVNTTINENISYDFVDNNINLYSLLAFSGYLSIHPNFPSNYYTVRIVNEEIKIAFNKEIMETLVNKDNFMILKKIKESLISFNTKEFVSNLAFYIQNRLSYLDLNSEKAYQIMIVTLGSVLMDDALVSSEIEEGQGRCDIVIRSISNNDYSIILELKYLKNRPSISDLEKSASKALNQIKEHKYYSDALRINSKRILLIGLSFSHKNSAFKDEVYR